MKKIYNGVWEIPAQGAMRVPARVIGTEEILKGFEHDRTLWQLKNVASLKGIYKWALLMPDGHEGYGFPIGGVAAFDTEDGVISPGGVGYDINCGVRTILTPLTPADLQGKERVLVEALFKRIPSGLGAAAHLKLSFNELDEVAVHGIDWAIEKGYGWPEDKKHTEERGRMDGADPKEISQRAKARGKNQLGTLGAGNHFLEIQTVERIFNEEVAKDFGLQPNQITVMIHCGSRGFGHQIASDYIPIMLRAAKRYSIALPDPQLAAAPFHSPEAQRYLKAMKAAVNYAFTNRHIIMHWVREVFSEIFGPSVAEEMPLLYDVAHNIAKVERHFGKELVVHRKGATRAFPASRPEVQAFTYGHPVMIPGSMGTASYILVGTEKALEISFGSSCHGAGRKMSRAKALRSYRGDEVVKLLGNRGILIKPASLRVAAEEAPGAYKNVDEVVKSVEIAGIAKPVARLKPLIVVKG